MGKENNNEDQYIELPKVSAEEILTDVYSTLSGFLHIKRGDLKINTFEDILKLEKDRLETYISVLPEFNSPLYSIFLGFISLLVGFLVFSKFSLRYSLTFLWASFLAIFGLLLFELLLYRETDILSLVNLFKALRLMIAPKHSHYLVYLHSKEFKPIIEFLNGHQKVREYFESISFEKEVYPRFKSIQFLFLIHVLLFLPWMFSSLPLDLDQIQTYQLIVLPAFLILMFIPLFLIENVRVESLLINKKKLLVFYLTCLIVSVGITLKLAPAMTIILLVSIPIFALMYIIVGQFLYYSIKFQNLKRILLSSYDLLTTLLFMTKSADNKDRKIKELSTHEILISAYFLSRRYNPLSPEFKTIKEDILEILDIYPDIGYLYFIDEEFVDFLVEFLISRLHKIPDSEK